MITRIHAGPGLACRGATNTTRTIPSPRQVITRTGSGSSGGGKTADADKASRDNRSTQLNPNNPIHQGGSTDYKGTGDKADLDNRSNQMNPNNPNYQPPKK